MENFLDLFTSASLSFLKQADLHSVLLITLLTFLVRRTFWAAFHWLPSFLVWVPLLLSFLLTPYISTAEEVGWGGTYYIRACLFNGAVASADEDHTSSVILCIHLVPAIVVRIVDGDTFAVHAQMWAHQTWEGSVRLRGINAPETRSKCQEEKDAAVKATAALTEILPVGKAVLLCNPEEDPYPGRVDATVLLPSGKTVSSLLLDLGVVRPYDGKKKRPPWCKEAMPAH